MKQTQLPLKKAEQQLSEPKNLNNSKHADRIKITFYTDPLCCWSWAIEPHWNRLRDELGDTIEWKYVMCGMIPDWNTYTDPINSVSRPLQMGPVWMHAAQLSNTKINYSIWHEDPPSSSYPSCIAVKCASLQSSLAEDLYLYKLREAVMLKGINIAKSNNLLDLAEELSKETPERFDIQRFKSDWNTNMPREEFKKDLQQSSYHKIGRFPTLTMVNSKGRGLMTVGYRPYAELLKAFEQTHSA